MENIFVLTVLVALAAVALLGIFLAASEKELKVKRREVEELLARLEAISPPSGAAAPQPPADHSAELAELRARNQELQNQVGTLAEKLELSRRSMDEMEASLRNSAATQSEIEQLRAANQQLKLEISQLERRQASETGGTVAAAELQEAAERHAQWQHEIMELKQKLHESHAKLNELEAYKQKAQRLDELEAERQRLQARLAQLESEVDSTQAQLREAAELRQRIVEAEQAQAALRAENERHEREIARWRERIAEGEEYRQRFAALQRPYEELLAKHASLAEQQRDFENQFAAFARLMPVMPPPNPDADSSGAAQSRVVELTDSQSRGAADPAEPAGATAIVSEQKPKRRLGLFSALILLGAGSFLGVKFLVSTSDQTSIPMASASPVVERRLPPLGSPAPAVAESATARRPSPSDQARPAPETAKLKQEAGKVNEVSGQEPRAAGTYQLTQASRVYAGPSELSQPIGEIEAGTKVNVVGGRGGWLEIHSQYGRPPGFIRKEVASRVAEQN